MISSRTLPHDRIIGALGEIFAQVLKPRGALDLGQR